MIKNIKVLPGKLNIIFSNNTEDNFPNIWIRDHARDDESWDKRSNQRKIFTAKIDPKLLIKKATLRDNGKSIDILWSDLKKPINYSSFLFIKNSSHLIKNVPNFKIWKKKRHQKRYIYRF